MNADYSERNAALGALYGEHIDVVRSRHDHALERAGAAHAVIYSGNPKRAFLDDYYLPFKANPHFLGWAPLTDLPYSCIVYTPGNTPVLVYYQPHDYWHVAPGTPDGYWTRHFDVRIARTPDDVIAHLPADRAKCIAIGEFDDEALDLGIERVNPATAVNILHFARGAKTDYELAVMRLASRRGVAGHLAAEKAFREGKSEFDIHRAYCEAVSHIDAELPYGNIIALNEHGAVLHYTNLDRDRPAEQRSFLIDAGAQVHGYASDITRTYAAGDERFQALIDRMHSMQLEIVGLVEAGVDYRDLHIATHRMLAAVLVEAELASGDPDSLLETGVTSAFFPHGLGHLLGIQVHDVGGHQANESGTVIDPPSGHPFLRLTRVLEEDMVLTIEPGLYVIDMLLDRLRGSQAEDHVNWSTVDWLRPFGGIRIEDDVRVMSGTRENLTRDAFAAAS
ncbi:MAG: Xaa-Pro dipeptidase [Gammaproteobacteria bacterium]|nr:Xaa-Pro dipeptidase [Gammaproteobacteria bacterium]MBT8104868.1 Xaa-Pro dipeptidase [Gammaproteobacteria bacterium]NNK24882.1 Xaa-Pro dipeptidase [Woeseiaceae bacterium]